MNRAALASLIEESYGAEAEYLWPKYPRFAVFRRRDNGKWFALLMEVPAVKLGLEGSETMDVVNFKSEPDLIGALRKEAGFFPAYHMNKETWITASLDGTVPDETMTMLLDLSYRLAGQKKGRPGTKRCRLAGSGRKPRP